MRLDAWMAACNAAYYASRDPFGQGGDFITAPEISQMFGEIIGGWIADLWLRAGGPPARLIELGPGRGTLMADALRVAAHAPRFADSVSIALVETSPTLRAVQARRVQADWYERLEDVPADRPALIIANEFFDALPIRQHLGNGDERAVTVSASGFTATTIPGEGAAGETCPAATTLAAHIGRPPRRAWRRRAHHRLWLCRHPGAGQPAGLAAPRQYRPFLSSPEPPT